ncbi:hypothetical protein CIB95_10765 [Lottiidibacillus patelloidae]|uniref:Uncharacterized protein n=1 Tax=Lottiidibacillus patelloidae TaxID=2670334 RepID=A0A263BU43_9BACI|nr:permease prefix domain 1-containing protein [Lottiidibacillus patelloidae]OZM56696.1 hypothetical protein CIB95_10765 [Lottiidibacillus patelloidae]
MKQIEKFVDEVYQSASGNKKEIEELKKEMKNHLLESVHELKSEGKSEQEAIELAIERFGGEKEIRSVVGQLFKAQKVFAKWMLNFALVFLVLGSVIFATMMFIGDKNYEKSEEVAFNLLERLGESEVLTAEIKKEITTIVEENETIKRIEVFNLDNNPDALRGEPDFMYQKDIWISEVFGNGWDNSGTDEEHVWFVGIGTKIHDSLAFNIFLVGVSIYWVLFTLWAIINAHHRNRLNAGWIIAFAFFNVIGYLVYSLRGKNAALSDK